MKINVFTVWILLPLLLTGFFPYRVSSAQQTALPRPELVPQTGHTVDVSSVTFSPDGKLLASGSWDNTVKLWNVEEGREVRTLGGHTDVVYSLAFSPDGKLLATCSADKTVKLWNVADGREVRTLTGAAEDVSSVAFSPDGKLLASGSWDKTIKLWNVAEGREVRTLTGYNGGARSIAFSPDGKLLATGSLDKTVKLWNVADGGEAGIFTGHTDIVSSVAFSPDGKLLASGSWDKTIKLWNVAEGREVRTLTGHMKVVNSIAFSPDGKILASGSDDKTIRLWNVPDGSEVRTLTGHTGVVTSVAFGPDGAHLATGSDDNTVRFWTVADGREVRTFARHSDVVMSIAFSPNGRLLASGSLDKTVKLWNVADGREVWTLTGHTKAVSSVAFSPDGKLLASGSEDETIRLWNVADGWEVRTLAGHTDVVLSVAFSPDGTLLASGSEDKTIRLWTVADGKEVLTLTGHTDAVRFVAFSPDGKILASGSEDKTIRLWNVAGGREMQTLTGHTNLVSSLAFSPDGKLLASASGDNTVKLWNVAGGREVQTLTGHTGVFVSIAFSQNGRVCATASSQGVGVWDVSSGAQLLTIFSVAKKNDWLVMTPEGLFDGTDTGIQSLVAWRVGNRVYPPDRFWESYYRPGLLTEILSGKRPKPAVDIAKLKLPPDIVITSPAGVSIMETNRIQLTAECTDQGGGVKELRLYHNGKHISTQQGRPGSKTSYTFQIDLIPNENVLGVKALSREQVESNLGEVRVVYKAPVVPGAAESAKTTLHLLVVGINRYEDPKFDLRFARTDAESILKFFQERGSSLFSVKPIFLADEQATKKAIQDALDKLETNKEDVLIVYLVGHGVGVGQQFYFLAHEMKEEEDEEAAYRNYGISATAIGDALFKADALKQILILDTCEAEAALPILTKLAFFKARGPNEDKALKLLARSRGIYLIAASTQVQRAYEVKELEHGVLTYVLLEGLGEKGPPKAERNGIVTVENLIPYVKEQVPELTEKYLNGKKQLPITTSTGTDFPLAVR